MTHQSHFVFQSMESDEVFQVVFVRPFAKDVQDEINIPEAILGQGVDGQVLAFHGAFQPGDKCHADRPRCGYCPCPHRDLPDGIEDHTGIR